MASAAVSQEVCCAVASALVPLHLVRGSLTAGTLLAACVVLMLTGYLTCALLGGHLLGGSVARGVRQAVLLTGGVYFLSPLLRSLTRTVSQDSVIALATALLLAHLYLYDYNFVNSVTDKLTGALSLSAACFAAILLSSQMGSDFDVFAQVLFSLELFLLSPFVRRYIKRASPLAHVVLALAMAAATAALLLPLSATGTAAFVAALAAVSFACPAALVRIHKFKAHISGPWDEAAPHIPRELVLLRPREAAGQAAGRAGAGAAHPVPGEASGVNGHAVREAVLGGASGGVVDALDVVVGIARPHVDSAPVGNRGSARLRSGTLATEPQGGMRQQGAHCAEGAAQPLSQQQQRQAQHLENGEGVGPPPCVALPTPAPRTRKGSRSAGSLFGDEVQAHAGSSEMSDALVKGGKGSRPAAQAAPGEGLSTGSMSYAQDGIDTLAAAGRSSAVVSRANGLCVGTAISRHAQRATGAPAKRRDKAGR